jgi:hypothetical protein
MPVVVLEAQPQRQIPLAEAIKDNEMKTTVNLEEALLSPSAVFTSPSEVLHAPGLSDADRRKILEQWKLDADRLEDSASENMTGGERSHLSDVSKALTALEQKNRADGT